MSDAIDMTAGVYRYVYSGYLRSKRMCGLTLDAEGWFWRIHSAADDYGNLPGDYCELRNLCAGRRDMPIAKIQSLTKQLIEAGLVEVYEADGDTWLHVVGWLSRQPSRRDGRRIRRYAEWPGEAKESEGVKIPRLFKAPQSIEPQSYAIVRNPDPSCASDSDTDSYTDTDSHPADPELERQLRGKPWTIGKARAAELVATHGANKVRYAMTLASKGDKPGGLLMHILRDGIDAADIPAPDPPPIAFASAAERNRSIKAFKESNPCAALWSDADTLKSKMFAEWHEGSRTQPTNDAR